MTWLIIGIVVLLFGFVVLFGAPYVPSQRRYLKHLFDHIRLGPNDTLVDLGSGDGVVLRVARRYGARVVGYELNPVLVAVSRMLSVGDKAVTTRLANAWRTRFPDETTIVYIFSVGQDEARLLKTMRREAERLGRPLRLICLGNPLKTITAEETFEAYSIYSIAPRHIKTLTV